MSYEIKIIGYSSDDVVETFRKEQAYKAKKRLLKWAELNKQEKIARQNSSDRESHVYLVRGEKMYFRIYREITDFVGYGKVQYLGIANEPIIIDKIKRLIPIKRYIGLKSVFVDGMTCCYCEIKLSKKNYTREHIIPKHKGGKIIMACCNKCNTEKGGLMLHSYIQILNLMMDETADFKLLQTKIYNANKILKEIEHKQNN